MILAVPGPIDMTAILIPSRPPPRVLGECDGEGIKGASVISAGFQETRGQNLLRGVRGEHSSDLDALAEGGRTQVDRDRRVGERRESHCLFEAPLLDHLDASPALRLEREGEAVDLTRALKRFGLQERSVRLEGMLD